METPSIFFLSYWIPGIKSKDMNMPVSTTMQNLIVADLIDVNSGSWKVEDLNQLFTQDQVNKILIIRINVNSRDKLRWTLNRCGQLLLYKICLRRASKRKYTSKQ